jgi:hypothetical protein
MVVRASPGESVSSVLVLSLEISKPLVTTRSWIRAATDRSGPQLLLPIPAGMSPSPFRSEESLHDEKLGSFLMTLKNLTKDESIRPSDYPVTGRMFSELEFEGSPFFIRPDTGMRSQ